MQKPTPAAFLPQLCHWDKGTEYARQTRPSLKPKAQCSQDSRYGTSIPSLSGTRPGDGGFWGPHLLHLHSKYIWKNRILIFTSLSINCPREGQTIQAKVQTKLSNHRPLARTSHGNTQETMRMPGIHSERGNSDVQW